MDYCSEDIEMMDTTDDNYDHNSTHTNVNKRNANHMNHTNDSNSNKSLKKSPNIQSRHVLKAKRISTKRSVTNESIGSESSDENDLICVLDTNILLSNLIELKNVVICEEKCRQMSRQSKLNSIIIPWVVVQELDYQKKNKTASDLKCVRNAIQFINEQLNKSNGLVKGENESKNTNSKTGSKRIDVETNDDKIINTCLKCSTNNVLLVSNDLNLCNKALMTELKAKNWKQFYRMYSNGSEQNRIETTVESDDNSDQTEEPKPKRLAKSSKTSPLKTDYNSVPYLRSSLSPKSSLSRKYSFSDVFSTFSAHSRPKPTSPDKRLHSKSSSIRKAKSSLKRKQLIKSPIKLVPKTTQICNNDSNNTERTACPLRYDDWIRFRDECEQKLLEFIKHIYREIWDKDWQQMLEIDVNNTNIKEIIRVVRKEWFANFSDHFNRDKSIKSLIDRLHTSLQQSDANYHLYYKDLQQFVDLVEQNPTECQKNFSKDFNKRKTF